MSVAVPSLKSISAAEINAFENKQKSFLRFHFQAVKCQRQTLTDLVDTFSSHVDVNKFWKIEIKIYDEGRPFSSPEAGCVPRLKKMSKVDIAFLLRHSQ